MTRHYFILIVALLAFTTSPILIRFSALSPAAIVTLRLFLALGMLLPFWIAEKDEKKVKAFLSPKILLSGFMLGAHFILWTISLSYTSIASASIAVCIAPVFVVLIERTILKRKLDRSTLSGLAIALLGVILLLADDLKIQKHGMLGVSLALAAAALSAVYLLIGEHARKTHRIFTYCMPVYFVGMLVSLFFGWWQGVLPWKLFAISPREWAIMLGLACIPTIFGHTAYNYILRNFSASTLSIAGLTQPFMATLAALAIFWEVPTVIGLFGGAVSILGVYWVLRGQKDVGLTEPQT